MALFFPRRFASSLIFDRSVKRVQRDKQAQSDEKYDILRDTVASRLVDRILDIKREFPVCVDLGAGNGNVRRAMANAALKSTDGKNLRGVNTFYQVEMSSLLLDKNVRQNKGNDSWNYINRNEDEEFFELPENSVDLVISNLSLHWMNDLINDRPAVFSRVLKMLKPDGVFLASMYGENTLQELRSAFALADMERLGGLSPHISPMVRIGDVGNLLVKTGFALPTVDAETFLVSFPDSFTLMSYLSGMGESTADNSRSQVSRDVFLAVNAIYDAMYAQDGFIKATFHTYYLIGWKPHESQSKPLNRGSGKAHLGDIEKLFKENDDKTL